MTEPPSPAAILDLATAYQRSKVLFALVELRIPALLAEGPRSADEVAARLGADRLAVERLLEACAALGLLTRVGGVFHNAPMTQRFLVDGAPAYFGDLLGRYERLSRSEAWSELAGRLRAWRADGPRAPISMEGTPVGGEVGGLHRLSLCVGEALARALDRSTMRNLLDLGGGTGAMSIALCRRRPALNALLLELPAMAPIARAHVRDSGLEGRIEVREGDFVREPLPRGCDMVLLANVLSLLSPDASRALLRRVFECLPAGGTVAISGWMADDGGRGPLASLLLSLEDIALGAPDVERSAATYAEWLGEAGFGQVEHAIYLEPSSYVTGRKPRSAA